jgi:hypothetical protein
MIKFFRKIRQNLLMENKTGKYFKYAIGEIVLVVIGILIALSINNWSEKQKEKKQIRNIYVRVVQDFNYTITEIDRDFAVMDSIHPLMVDILLGEVVRDSLFTNKAYLSKYYNSISSYPDIKINETGIRLLESKIELNYELNNELTEALALLYSEDLFEFETDARSLLKFHQQLLNYTLEKGIVLDYLVHNNPATFIAMIFEDDTFKSYLLAYQSAYGLINKRLKDFKAKGQVLMDQIKTEYNLE